MDCSRLKEGKSTQTNAMHEISLYTRLGKKTDYTIRHFGDNWENVSAFSTIGNYC